MTDMRYEEIEQVVREIVHQLTATKPQANQPGIPSGDTPPARPMPVGSAPPTTDGAMIDDIRAVDYRQVYTVPNPANPEVFARMKARTWARLGQGRSGPRYTTAAQLRFWADHAAAMDAVATDVPESLLQDLGLFTVQTRCTSKADYLADPELGARFDDAVLDEIAARCTPNPDVQVFVTDGLSSTAVEVNIAQLLPALEQGLQLHGLRMGTPFFVKYGRVRSMEPISERLGATVTCVLVGERPGLATAESLSAYLAYKARVGMPEAERTCVSNIHEHGSNAIEAGAHLADLIAAMISQQASGINLKL